ncbi:hypothetical protein K7X08_002089 [Anisodus acutangulus]|uniref:Uncharacterized protein n=1 Tax=Anisodus acutangulus TaxID=402998 RepID=A0A9Q1LNK8_9SOLA|nr:hypothetical protein K7X08_002089 [Anisodus acutangulus]
MKQRSNFLFSSYPHTDFISSNSISLREKVERERVREIGDGERKDSDKEDRQFDEQASDVLEEEKRIVEEGEGASDPVRC